MKNFTNKTKYISVIFVLVLFFGAGGKIVNAAQVSDSFGGYDQCSPTIIPPPWFDQSDCPDYDNDNDDDDDNDNDNDSLNVVTRSAINIDEDSATMRGEITDLDESEDYVRFFQWGTSSSNLNQTSTLSGTTDNTGTFSLTLSGLNDDDTYYYRACAENTDNSNDDDCGSVYYFTTDEDNSSNNDNDNDNDNDGVVLGASDGNLVTTDATNITATSATLNGVVNTGSGPVTVWFEYGPTVNLGYTTSTKTIYANQSIVSTTIYGLAPGKAYFFRIASTNGERGDFKAFITNSATVTSTVGTITTNNNSNNVSKPTENTNTNTGEILFETIQYLKVELVPSAKDVRPGDKVAFEVIYENLSDKNLQDIIMVVDFPKEMSVTDVGPGKLLSSQQIEVRIPVLPAYTKGNFGITAQVGARTPDETFLVSVVSAKFDHPVEQNNRVETLNSAIIRVSALAAPSQIASVIGAGFFPATFLGWIVLLAAIVLLIYLSRKLYKEREEDKKKKEEALRANHPELKIAR